MTSYPPTVSDGLSLPCGVCGVYPVLGAEIVLPGLERIQVATPEITADFRPVEIYRKR